MHRATLIVLLLIVFLVGCDEGLKPVAGSPTGRFTGLIRFINWQAADSVYDMRLVAFRHFPPPDIVGEVFAGRAIVYPPIGAGALVNIGADSLRYQVTAPTGEYQYVVVAQQFGPNQMADWRPVGQYDLDTNFAVPSPIVVPANGIITGIDILVDFAHPPPPPF
jgi:hypothetical protein